MAMANKIQIYKMDITVRINLIVLAWKTHFPTFFPLPYDSTNPVHSCPGRAIRNRKIKRPVLCLRFQVPVGAFAGHPDRVFFLLPHHGLIFGSGDVLSGRFVVSDGFNGLAVVVPFVRVLTSIDFFCLF